MNRPPITAKAIGDRSEAPSPNPKHIGNKARIVVRLVMMIGRIRCWAAPFMASVSVNPSALSLLAASTSKMELLTAIPASMMIPIKAIIFNVWPVIKKANILPTPAKGIVNKIVKGCLKDSNCAAMTIYTNTMDKIRANPKPLKDSARFSSSPVILAEYLAGNSISAIQARTAGVISPTSLSPPPPDSDSF